MIELLDERSDLIMIYRLAMLEDAEKLDNLLSKLIEDEKNKYDDSIEFTAVKDFYKNIISKENTLIYLCEDKSLIVGYIYAFIDGNKGKIDALFVEKDYRNKKIASNLMQYTKNWFKEKNIDDVEISVLSDNIIAKKLYSKSGFVTFKEIMKLDIGINKK